MLRYRNTSVTAKTFYGVTFQPGEEKDVSGYINDSKMIRVEPTECKPRAAKRATVLSTHADNKPAPAETTETKQSKESNKEEN